MVEASGLEAKDCNGYSDPYCMLGICPAIKGATVASLTTPDEVGSNENESNLYPATNGLMAANDTPSSTIRRG